MNTPELIVRCKAHLTRIEEMAARGMKDGSVLLEVARFAGVANVLRWEAEAEYDMSRLATETRERAQRDAAAGVCQ